MTGVEEALLDEVARARENLDELVEIYGAPIMFPALIRLRGNLDEIEALASQVGDPDEY